MPALPRRGHSGMCAARPISDLGTFDAVPTTNAPIIG